MALNYCLVILEIVSLVYSKECYWNRQCGYQLYSSKTPYDSVRGDVRDVPTLEGCEPISVWSLNRHGNRNPSSSVIANAKTIYNLRDQIVASYVAGTSELCAQDIDEFRKFTWNETIETSASFLTGEGYEELYDLAVRIKEKYPQIVNATGDDFYLRPTLEQRTIVSAVAFLHGLTDGTSINGTVDEARAIDEIIRPYASCDRYQNEVRGQKPPVDEQIADFQNTAEYATVQQAVQRRLGISYQLTRNDVYYFYEICRFYRSWTENHKSPWCSVFSDDDIYVLEYRDDLRHYYRNGYGNWMNPNLGRRAVKDMYENFVAAANGQGKKVVAYFSHDTMLQMVFAALGLYKDDFTLFGNNMIPERKWKTSNIASFTTNILAVLHRCGPTINENRLQILVNEKETELCPLSGCTWQEFVNRFEEYNDANTDFCSLDYVFPVTTTTEAPSSASMTLGVFTTLFLTQLLLCSRR